MIYEVLFVSDHPEKLITPDLVWYHRDQPRGPNLSNCLPLLQTCQNVHEEAVSVLYGSNVFTFNDQRHDTEGMGVVEFIFTVQRCDFAPMLLFLIRIGRRNRARIHHLRLHFMSTVFIAYRGEVEQGSHSVERRGAANWIGDSLELLSSNHNLHSFELIFGSKDSVTHRVNTHKEFQFMFGGETPRKLVQKMMLFKNVREVKDLHLGTSHLSDGRRDWALTGRDINLTKLKGLQDVQANFPTNAYNNFLALKREMEAEEPDQGEAQNKTVTYTEGENPSGEETAYGFRRNPIDQTNGAAEGHDNQTLQ